VGLSATPPVISVADPVRDAAAAPDKPAAAKVVMEKTYVIVAGDNLAKIAKKFYGTMKESDVKRIVAANPTVLKDEKANLIVGKKLVIPDVQQASKPAAKVLTAEKTVPVMIYVPGSGSAQAQAGDKAAVGPTKKDSGKTYEVKSGDTLEKIARKYAPSHATEYVAKLKSLNGIKDPTALQAGQTLKLPA
jgi:nucleoid-associated protein YgaU